MSRVDLCVGVCFVREGTDKWAKEKKKASDPAENEDEEGMESVAYVCFSLVDQEWGTIYSTEKKKKIIKESEQQLPPYLYISQ